MNLRTDSAHIAGWRRAYQLGAAPEINVRWALSDLAPDESAITAAQPGDVWSIGDGMKGYCLTCPNAACIEGIHCWTHVRDCSQRKDPSHLSCWTWTGSPEAGDLTAQPSLHVVAEWGGCGWHGWLRAGEMVPA